MMPIEKKTINHKIKINFKRKCKPEQQPDNSLQNIFILIPLLPCTHVHSPTPNAFETLKDVMNLSLSKQKKTPKFKIELMNSERRGKHLAGEWKRTCKP